MQHIPKSTREEVRKRAQGLCLKDRVRKKEEQDAERVRQKELEEELEKNEVLDFMDRFLSAPDWTRHTWIFLSVTCFTSEALDFPGEVAIAKWSLNKGVEDTLHMVSNIIFKLEISSSSKSLLSALTQAIFQTEQFAKLS